MNNAAIVFVHGAGDSAGIWSQLPARFGAHAVIAIDLPGHGQRPDTLPPQISIADYAHAVRQIIREELQLEQVILAGHSMGGAIALTLALEQSAELCGLILMATGARLRVHPDLLAAAQSAPQEALRMMSAWGFSSASLPPQHTAREAGPGEGLSQLYRDLAACNAFDCMERVGEIRLPTLIIVGEDDRMTPVKYSRYLHERIAGSSLHVIPAAGHYLMREQPEALSRIIAGWIADAPSTPSPASCYNTASGFPHEDDSGAGTVFTHPDQTR
jgi:pimeloyl-ACP methyl ester carboxylesterase